MPDILYKYFPHGNVYFNELHLTRRDLLNDPYDSMVRGNHSKYYDCGDLKKLLISKLEERGCNKELTSLIRDLEHLSDILHIIRDRRLLSESDLTTIDSTKPISFPLRVEQNCYVGSLSIHRDSPLMWSHYANSHRGICIGYEFKALESAVTAGLGDSGYYYLESVKYGESPCAPFSTGTDNWGDELVNCLTTKHNLWFYEDEWRALNINADNITATMSGGDRVDLPVRRVIQLEINLIKEILFGARMTPDEIVQIRGHINRQYGDQSGDIEYKQMVIVRDRYTPQVISLN